MQRSLLDRWAALKVRLSVVLFWNSNRRRAEAIRGFQATEADGVWHLQRGFQRLEDPRQRAAVFLHMLEEESHADEFAEAYKTYADHPLGPSPYEREDLYDPSAPPWKSFAFVHIGERDATRKFRFLEEALEEGPLKSSLARIVRDESGHVGLTHTMLERLGADSDEVRSELLRVRLVRAWETWLRAGKRIADVIATVLLSTAYFLAGPFFAASARKRLKDRLVAPDNNRIKGVLTP
jgi:hypothetical protein